MKKVIQPVIFGVCLCVMAAAAGIESFSGNWWAWTVAGAIALTMSDRR